jgi:sulfatase modifying factor 1
MARVESFCIDRYEAHLLVTGQTESVHPPHERPRPGGEYVARSQPGVLPQGYVNRSEASDACARAGKRLCSAREWQQACKGPHGWTHPYGPKEEKGRCNTRKPHLPSKLFGRSAMRWPEASFNSPLLAQTPGFLAKAGEYARCVSEYGVFDLEGNLHEWVRDDANRALLEKIRIPYGAQGMGPRGSAVFMGGYFSSSGEHGHGCEYVTTHHAASYHDYSTGFRCCTDARLEPEK